MATPCICRQVAHKYPCKLITVGSFVNKIHIYLFIHCMWAHTWMLEDILRESVLSLYHVVQHRDQTHATRVGGSCFTYEAVSLPAQLFLTM